MTSLDWIMVGVALAASMFAGLLSAIETALLKVSPTKAERLVADLSGAVPLAMEGSAATIWEKIARSRGTTATRLVEMVADEVGLTPADISADVLAFLDSLREQKLFERYLP